MEELSIKPENDLSCGYVKVYKRQTLGLGSYGIVYMARCGQLPCMAKVFHDALFKHDTEDAQELTVKLEEDCKQLSNIKHPHLLVYLGFVRDAETRRLLLLMESMDENLTQFLERIDGPVPQDQQVQICHDVALGLAYLHSINSIHRNLSSNNVLLLSGRRAKVCDYGISSLANFDAIQMSMSVYMPPEALVTPPSYSDKTDSFSYGVLLVQIVSKLPPNPSPSSEYLEYTTGKAPVQGMVRRTACVDQVDLNHPLLSIAQDCLRNEVNERPTTSELCESLEKLMETESRATDDAPKDRVLRREMKAALGIADSDSYTLQIFRDKLGQLLQELNDRDDQIAQRDRTIDKMDTLVQERTELVAAMEKQLKDKDKLISHLQKKTKKMKSKGKSTPPPPPSSSPPPSLLSSSSLQLSSQAMESIKGNTAAAPGERREAEHLSKPRRYIPRKLLAPPSLEWSTGQPAPRALNSYRGSAVVDGNRAYFSHIHNIYSYTTTTNKWIQLPECTRSYFGLVVVREHLVAVGGVTGRRSRGEVTNALVGLTHRKIWDDILPPMPTKRAFAAAATTSTHLIVAGGRAAVAGEGLATVESLDLESLQWSTASSLLVPLENPQLVMCGNDLYAVDADSSQVHVCSINAVVSQMTPAVLKNPSLGSDDTSSFENQPLQATLPAPSAPDQESRSWRRICALPSNGGVRLLVEGNKVLALGGHDHKHHPIGTMACYDRDRDMWNCVGKLAMPKWGVLAVSLSNRKIMVVGGNVGAQENCESTDIASLNFEL